MGFLGQLSFIVSLLLLCPELRAAQTKTCDPTAPSLSEQFGGRFWDEDPHFALNEVTPICQELSSDFLASAADKKEQQVLEDLKGLSLLLQSQSPDFQRRFHLKIAELRKVPSLNQKIRQSYLAAVAAFGEMNLNQKSLKDPQLLRLRQSGAGPRHFDKVAVVALFLSEALKNNNSKIKIKLVTGRVQETFAEPRLWLRLDSPKSAKAEAFQFDLDPSLSGLHFSPLFPRRVSQSATKRDLASADCQKLKHCLIRQALIQRKLKSP